MTDRYRSHVGKGGVIRPLLAFVMAMISGGVGGCSAAEATAPYLKCEGAVVQLDATKLENLMSQVDRFMMTTSDISKSYADPAIAERRHGVLIRLASARQVGFRQPWMKEDFHKDILAIKFHGDKPAITTYLIGADGYIVTVVGGDRNNLEAMLQVYGCRM